MSSNKSPTFVTAMLGFCMIKESTILQLQQIILEEYKVEVTIQEATKIANDIVGYFDLLAKLHHRIQFENDEQNSQGV